MTSSAFIPPPMPLRLPAEVAKLSVMDKMLILAPVHICLRGGFYECTWTLNVPYWWVAMGRGSSWAGAAYDSWKVARANGWVIE